MPTYDQRMPTYDQRMPTYDQRMTNVFVAYVCRVRRILNVPSAYNEHVTYAAVERIYKGQISDNIDCCPNINDT